MMHTINVGKAGVTENTILEIKKQLKRHGEIRVKLLPGAGDERKALMKQIADQVGAKVVSSVGFVMVLEK